MKTLSHLKVPTDGSNRLRLLVGTSVALQNTSVVIQNTPVVLQNASVALQNRSNGASIVVHFIASSRSSRWDFSMGTFKETAAR